MNSQLLLFSFLFPIVTCVLIAFIPQSLKGLPSAFAVAVSAINLIAAIVLFQAPETLTEFPWLPFNITFSLRLYSFSSFILLAAAGFALLIAIYSVAFMQNRAHPKQYFAYFLLTLGLVNGAALANDLILLLFFWEGLLLTLFGMIIIGRPEAFKSATKALIISGTADLCLMIGVGLVITLSNSSSMQSIHLPLTSSAAQAAFILMMIGAIAKAGSMPFHSWIPDAALDAPLPFMAFVPAALEKLLGIYLLARITLDLFQFTPESWLSPLLMIIGCVTILLAVLMALVQKDYKRLLSFHAISQVGYMILGIGTAIPVGIAGGLFHMINHAIYKSCLFLTGGSVEKQAGTTDLRKLGGLARQMPITFFCFIVAAASISGVPPFNGFFSKELVYDGALERGWPFYAAALLGSFLTAASFLKLGHAAYLDRGRIQKEAGSEPVVREAPWAMLIAPITLALFCIFFGLGNAIPLKHLILPVLGNMPAGEHGSAHEISGWPSSITLIALTLVVLAAAYLNHRFGVKKAGSGLGASDHIHHAPGFEVMYSKAEKRFFDPYEIGLKLAGGFAKYSFQIDRAIDWFYDRLVVSISGIFGRGIRRAHSGQPALYLSWSFAGLLVVIIYFLQK